MKPLWTTNDWTFELLEQVDVEIAKIAFDELKLTCFSNQIEIITSEQMIDAYTSHGLPLMYSHWSFGKHFVQQAESYKRGRSGLAYEIIINSDPSIAYCMEENTMTMQALVIAHASYGHNSFFKNNYFFKQWTSPDAIVDYFLFAKNFISKCEDEYGLKEVEELLDSCHALMNHGIDKYKKPKKLSKTKEMERQQERREYRQKMLDDLWKTLPTYEKEEDKIEEKKRFLKEPQENLLYFIEKNAPLLEDWQREIIRIIRKISQYFYPQMQTKVMNEGWACFCHYTIMTRLYEKGLMLEGSFLEFLQSHTSVVYQPAWDSNHYSGGMSPYYLGFNMYMDIKRICEEPTEEDEKWFPELVGTDWLESLHYAMENFKDESFILQYLSPKLIRDLKLFLILDDDDAPTYEVTAIHDDAGYRLVREEIAKMHDVNTRLPNIQITDFSIESDRALFLKHEQVDQVPLGNSTEEMMRHLQRLWGFDVLMDSYNPTTEKVTDTFACYKDGTFEQTDNRPPKAPPSTSIGYF